MTNTPFTTAAMTTLAVFLCLGLPARICACTECICATDNTCSNDECSVDLTTNCTRLEFSPECDGEYAFYAAVNSCETLCGKCYSCVNLFKVSGGNEIWVANCHTNLCSVDECGTTCSSVSLTSSSTYVLYVCKLYCADYEGVEDCGDCDASCVAVGCLSYGLSTIPCTP